MEMGTIDGEVITTLLQAYQAVFTLGIGRLLPDARWILLSLLTIEIAVLGLWIAVGYHQNIAAALIEMGIKTAVYLFLITNWSMLTRALIKGFVYFGLHAGGDVISETDFTDPSRLATFGISAMSLVYNRIFAYTGWDILFNLQDIVFTGGAATCVLIVYIIFGIQVAVALIQFYGNSTVTTVMIPWGMLRQTSFVAEKAFAVCWAHAIKLMVLALIAGVTLTIMKKLSPGLNPRFGDCVTLGIGGALSVVLALVGPKMALSLLSGAPNLSAQDLTQFARSTSRMIQTLIHSIRSLAPTPNRPPSQPAQGRPVA